MATPDRRRRITCLGIESTAHTFGVAVAARAPRGQGHLTVDLKDVYTPPPGAGIHPREAATHHLEVAPSLLRATLHQARLRTAELDAVAYAMGPGLGPCLRVGAVIARALAAHHEKPLVPVNHAIGHVELGCLLTGARDPLVLLVTGGHTLITAFENGRWRIFGETLDLTVGQLLDQFGRELGYASPCGAKIEELASHTDEFVPLPYVVKGQDVSFSGILTAAKTELRAGRPREVLAYSVQEVAFALLAEVTERALAFTEKRELMVVGGVAANRRLQSMLSPLAERHRSECFFVPKAYSGDCGAQIAWTGLLGFGAGISIPIPQSGIRQAWRIDQVDVPWRS